MPLVYKYSLLQYIDVISLLCAVNVVNLYKWLAGFVIVYSCSLPDYVDRAMQVPDFNQHTLVNV